jgi:acetamidase/formamidase
VATIDPGDLLSIDTISHEGLLPDQGRDPVAFFGALGVKPDGVLADGIAAAAEVPHDPDPATAGPHLVTGPVRVRGTRPGDVVRVEVVELVRRVDYGLITDRHAKDVFAADRAGAPAVQWRFCTVETGNGNGSSSGTDSGTDAHAGVGRMASPTGRVLRFRLAPFLGLLGVATDTDDEAHSSPPGRHGGNLDLRHTVVGAAMFLPVQVDGALLYAGDPHFAQGNGEVASTALEASLTAVLRVDVVPPGTARALFAALTSPVVEDEHYWYVAGVDADLRRATRIACGQAVRMLGELHDLDATTALAFLSVAGDLEITQVVNGVVGAHMKIPKNPLT